MKDDSIQPIEGKVDWIEKAADELRESAHYYNDFGNELSASWNEDPAVILRKHAPAMPDFSKIKFVEREAEWGKFLLIIRRFTMARSKWYRGQIIFMNKAESEDYNLWYSADFNTELAAQESTIAALKRICMGEK